VDRYVDRKQMIIDGIERGRADVVAGHIVENDAAFIELRATIDSSGHVSGGGGVIFGIEEE
jgi:predicted transcriptional regulator